MKTPLILLLAVLLPIFTSCDTEEEAKPAYYPVDQADNNFTIQGETFSITDAEYRYVNGDTYLYLKGEGMTDRVTIGFANRESIPTGGIVYQGDRYSGYIVEGNFWTATVATPTVPLGFAVDSGSIIITTNVYGQYKMSFLFGTSVGTAKGEYTGILHQRL